MNELDTLTLSELIYLYKILLDGKEPGEMQYSFLSPLKTEIINRIQNNKTMKTIDEKLQETNNRIDELKRGLERLQKPTTTDDELPYIKAPKKSTAWIPFPEFIPKKVEGYRKDRYLVTIKAMDIFPECVVISLWDDDKQAFMDNMTDNKSTMNAAVIAFQPLPEPYQP